MEEERKYTLKELREMANILKHDVTGSPIGTQVAHGPAYEGLPSAGLFSRPGPRPNMFSTNVQPAGLMDVLPIHTTIITNPEYEILTGVTSARGDNATSFCAPAAKAGFLKSCIQTARFGEMMMETDTVVINKTGGRLNFGDTDRNLMNPKNIPAYLPDLLRRARNINSQDWFQLFAMATQMMRAMEEVVFTGNHTLSSANTVKGFIKEFDGLDRLIKTGHVDAETDTACAAVDSIVEDWGDNDLSATVNGDTFVQLAANLFYVLEQLANDSGLSAAGPTTWALMLYPDMFYALTRVWPCLDMLAGCSIVIDGANINASNNIDGEAQRRLQDDMYMNRYLPIDGKRIPVILSQGVPIEASGNGFSGPMYIVPLAVMGGYETLYIEGFKQDNPEAMAMATLTGDDGYKTFNDGFWAAASSRTKFCMEYAFAAQPRLILETPWLAARIDGINFRLNRYSRQFRPGDPYYANGGVTIRYADTLYS